MRATWQCVTIILTFCPPNRETCLPLLCQRCTLCAYCYRSGNSPTYRQTQWRRKLLCVMKRIVLTVSCIARTENQGRQFRQKNGQNVRFHHLGNLKSIVNAQIGFASRVYVVNMTECALVCLWVRVFEYLNWISFCALHLLCVFAIVSACTTAID